MKYDTSTLGIVYFLEMLMGINDHQCPTRVNLLKELNKLSGWFRFCFPINTVLDDMVKNTTASNEMYYPDGVNNI